MTHDKTHGSPYDRGSADYYYGRMLEIIKWLGTACVIIAASCRAFEFHTADLVISILGAGLWGYASIVMKDKALFVVNAFVVSILFVGVII